jgi:hypothetical protein
MLARLMRKGFSDAERVGKRKSVTIVRAYHPLHGWMYEKMAEADDAAVDAWAARANKPSEKPKRVGEI